MCKQSIRCVISTFWSKSNDWTRPWDYVHSFDCSGWELLCKYAITSLILSSSSSNHVQFVIWSNVRERTRVRERGRREYLHLNTIHPHVTFLHLIIWRILWARCSIQNMNSKVTPRTTSIVVNKENYFVSPFLPYYPQIYEIMLLFFFERKKKIFFFFFFVSTSLDRRLNQLILEDERWSRAYFFALLFFHLRTVDSNRSHNVVVFLPFSLCTTCSLAYQLYLSKKIALYISRSYVIYRAINYDRI